MRTQFSRLTAISNAKVSSKAGSASELSCAPGPRAVAWPLNALQMNRFGTVPFDTQGFVPVGYSFFAVAVGILAGAHLRRTVIAMGATLAIAGVVRYVMDEYVRPHYLPAKSIVVSAATGFGNTPAGGGSWALGETFINSSGRVVATPGGKISPAAIPAECRQVYYSDSGLGRCLSTHGVHAVVSYQPSSLLAIPGN